MPEPSAHAARFQATWQEAPSVPARSGSVKALPPDAARAQDDLTPGQRRALIGAMVGVHVLALWALLQVDAVRESVLQAAPIFVDWVAPPDPVPPPPPPRRPQARPLPAPAPVIAAPPSPAPAAFVVAAPPPEPTPTVVTPAPLLPSPPAPPLPPPPPPRLIPSSALQFSVPPVVEYPRVSQRNGEAGSVLVRADITAAGGAPRHVQVERSSGFVRLDQAAVTAVQQARFKPPSENGQPIEGWALIPIVFGLEK